MTPIDIGGVRYARPEHTTFDQDIYLMERVRAAGLDKLQVGRKETPPQFVERLQAELAPVLLPVLAGMLVPEGEAWTRDVAARTERHLGQTTAARDKALLRAQGAALLAHFFASGIASARISPSSSGEGEVPSEVPKPTPSPTEGPRHTANGRRSSGSSRTTTRTEPTTS